MNDRICYLERTDRGLAIAGIRLVSAHADDHWDAPAGGSTDAVLETIEEGASWIKHRLKSGSGSSKFLPILCLDTDGAVCTWTKPEDSSPEMIAAAIDQLEGQHDDDGLEAAVHSTMGERFPNLPLEVNYESLADDETSDGSRKAVLATPDVPARLLIDQLDASGIRIGRVDSIWSLIARAWDPGSSQNSSARASSRVVSTDDPVCGTLILDPDRARLIWTWSRKGRLIASGSMRVQMGPNGPALHEGDLSRLCTDWLGWASQLGVAPLRVVLVVPEFESGDENALDRAKIGNVFGKHWPTATIDLITEPDPILKTLRTIQGIDEPLDDAHDATGFGGQLTNRPGRSHRSMYRWAGVMFLIASGCIGWIAWSLWTTGSKTMAEAKDIRSEMVRQATTLQPPILDMRGLSVELQARVNALKAKSGPVNVVPTKPVLEELETISYVLGMSGIEIDTIQLTNTLVKVKIRAADLQIAEQINEALRSISDSNLQWRATPDLTNRGTQIEASYTATWNTGSSS